MTIARMAAGVVSLIVFKFAGGRRVSAALEVLACLEAAGHGWQLLAGSRHAAIESGSPEAPAVGCSDTAGYPSVYQ